MTPQRHARVKELFLQAIELPLTQRAAWLIEACAGDASLRKEVEILLEQQSVENPAPMSQDETMAVGGSAHPRSVQMDTIATPSPSKTNQSSGDDASLRAPGTMIAGRYRIVSRLGKGGMGVVYRADDLTLNQTVAIKFLPAEVASNPAWLERFRNEARLARSVTHPNVCRVHDIGESQGEFFLTMEFVPGEDLSGLLRRIGRVAGDRAVLIARQVCMGLAAAHRAGVLHRDLKPANIMIDAEGNARITDFGIAGMSGQIAEREVCAGTPAYMAPEQIAGRDVSTQSDLYSLGLVLYELFSGQPAFHATTFGDYLSLHESATPAPLSNTVHDLPDGIEAIINQCLDKDPRNRPASALHVAAALPGVDVLHMAIESGMTPSPDLVAAAPARKGDPKKRLLFVGGALSLITLAVVLRSTFPIQWDAMGASPPSALIERARQLLSTSGLAMQGANEAWGFEVTEDAWRAASAAFEDSNQEHIIAPAEPSEPCFFFRQSDQPLIASAWENVFWGSGRATIQDPHPAGSTDRIVIFDKNGQLIFLGADVHSSRAEAASQSESESVATLDSLARAAGWSADSLALGSSEKLDDERPHCRITTIEPAGGNGTASRSAMVCATETGLALFSVGRPATFDAPGVGGAGTDRKAAIITLQRAMFLVLQVIAFILGVVKLRGDKADLQGALRLAVFVILIEAIARVLRLPAWGTIHDLVAQLSMSMIRAAGVGALLGVSFMALDAYARRIWPHLLVTWNRLLLRRWGDADVRFHILLGTTVGCWWSFSAAAERAIIVASGIAPRPFFASEFVIEKLRGLVPAMASYLQSVQQAVVFGLLFLLMIVVIRMGLRKARLSAVVCGLVLAVLLVPRGLHPFTAWFFVGVASIGVGIWMMIQYGLLSLVSAIFVHSVINMTPMNLGSGSWTFDYSIFSILIVLSLIGYGARYARR